MSQKLKQDISIGSNLRKYRKAMGFSQKVVAAKLQVQGLDIHEKIISDLEMGRYSVRVSVLLALAEMYRVPIEAFFADLERYE